MKKNTFSLFIDIFKLHNSLSKKSIERKKILSPHEIFFAYSDIQLTLVCHSVICDLNLDKNYIHKD